MEENEGRGRRTRVMIVEDERIVAEDIRRTLLGLGYEVNGVAATGDRALEMVDAARPDLVLMDIRLKGGMDGLTAAEEIRHRHGVPVVFLTAYADDDTIRRAKASGPYGYVIKPFEARELHSTIQMALHHHEMDRKLRESEQLYQTLAENSPAGIFILRKGRFVYVNRTMVEMLGAGPDDVIGTYITDLVHRADGQKIRGTYEGALKGEGPGKVEVRLRTANRFRWVEITTTAIQYGGERCIMGIAMDITDRRVLEAEAWRAQKLDAMSAMGMGLAHELNNIMNTVIGAAQLVHSRISDDDLREWLREIQAGGKRASTLINQIMDVSALTVGKAEHSAKLLIKGTIKMMGMSLPEHISVSVDVDPGDYRVIASPEELQAVVIRLVEYAIDRLDEGGTVHVRLSNLGGRTAEEYNLVPGEYISLEVAAPGAGLSQKELERALDPATGSGDREEAGLARVREMVTRNHGIIKVE
ncbi:MAG TPA: response regulator, partial [Thermoplasmata archaeon]|nr:response regulator [Thermoplasmata archaeon]